LSIPHLQVYRTDVPTREPSTLLIVKLCHDQFFGILRVSSIALLFPVSALDSSRPGLLELLLLLRNVIKIDRVERRLLESLVPGTDSRIAVSPSCGWIESVD
jgi:hypothetical protein